ncbi:helix-turn-helix domain-containing protein [Streptomyces abikoensis]
MPPSTPSPTIRRRRLGTELRRLCERADLTATEAGARLGITQSRVSSIEAGRYGVSAERVRTFAITYDCADQALVDALAAMTGERRRGWWEEYRDTLPGGLTDLAELEHHATALRVAQVIHVPGLLQTTDQARTIFREAVPQLLPHEIEFRVSHRIKRQAILYRDTPPPYTAIIHEAALRMQFGGRAVAKAQLDHLLDMGERADITIRVIPFGGVTFPTTGGVDYFHGPVPQLDTLMLDVAPGGAVIDAPAQLEKYRQMLDRMETIALDQKASRELIHHIAKTV